MSMRKHMYLMLFSFITVMLLVSSTAAMSKTLSNNITPNSLDSSINLEFANVVAGLDLATYQQVFVFGGNDGSNLPVSDSSTGLAETSGWIFLYSSQSGFEQYLNRLPMDAPDGASLLLLYPKTTTATISKAASAAALFESEYSISLYLTYFDGGPGVPDFYMFSSNASIMADVAADVAAIDNDGYSLLMDPSVVSSSPVSWAGYGVRNLASSRVTMHGMGWVDPAGLSKSGSVYTLSSDVFPHAVEPATSPADGLSRLEYYFPYPISPITNGITPATSNPLPHVTGRMIWDQRHPIHRFSLGVAPEYSVSYELGMDSNYPNVQNVMTINQTKLNQDGELEVNFNMKNIGQKDAYNVNMAFPLGPDFGALTERNITIYTIKDQYTLDESFKADYYLDFSTTPTSPYEFNSLTFTLDGWYRNSTGDLALWDSSTTSLVLFSGTVSGVSVVFSIQSATGFPIPFIDGVNTYIVPNMPTTVTSFDDILNPVKNNFGKVLNHVFNASFNEIYQAEDKLIFDPGDFDLFHEQVAINSVETQDRWFLNTTIDHLAPGEEKSLSFYMHDVPTTADTLALMDFTKGTNSQGYPNATLSSHVQNYNEFMQYAFEMFGFDGRPLSFQLPPDFNLGLDEYTTGVYGSLGMTFTWENANGYPFFGLSNGQNMQIADDEAVIAASVELDKQNYIVGDPVTITTELTNYGDIPADDVVVHLYHSTLGRDYQLERIDKITDIDVGSLAAGASTTVSWSDVANTYLGYHTVFAIVEFISDAGQGPEPLPDFLDLGITGFTAGGETQHFVMSTLSGALLLPESFRAAPSIPEPIISLTTAITGEGVSTALDLSAGEQFTYTVTITNEGDASTNVTLSQAYNTDELTLVSVNSELGSISQENGLVTVSTIPLAPGESTTVDIVFELQGDGAVLPPAVAAFTVDGDSSLGDTVNTGVDISVSATSPSSILTVSADSAAEGQSQKSGSEDASSSSFSASSSIGASVDTNIGGQESTVTDVGFVGYSFFEVLALMAIPIVSVTIFKKRK